MSLTSWTPLLRNPRSSLHNTRGNSRGAGIWTARGGQMASPSPLGLPPGCWRCDGAKVGPCSNQAALPSAPFAAAPEHPRMAQLVPPGTIFLWVECRHLLSGQAALQGKNKPSRGCSSQFVKHYKIFFEKNPKQHKINPLLFGK